MRHRNDLWFPIAMWLVSRALVLVALLAAGGPDAFLHWDGAWYRDVALKGYEYRSDGAQHNVAFLPMFPLLLAGGHAIGVPFAIAAALINVAASLVALIALHDWMQDRLTPQQSRAVTAVVALLPLSLFTVVAYSEATYLALSVLALRALDRGHIAVAAVCSALAALTRPIGIVLALPALVRARRDRRTLFVVAAACGGLAVYATYLFHLFGDALAFVHVQSAWRNEYDGGRSTWRHTIMQGFGFSRDTGRFDAPLRLLAQGIIAGGMLVIWQRRRALNVPLATIVAAVLVAGEWSLWGADAARVTVVVLGGIALGAECTTISPSLVIYGIAALGIVLFSGSTLSVERIVYGALLLPVALGVAIARFERFGYGVYPVLAVTLTIDTIRFARGLWVA